VWVNPSSWGAEHGGSDVGTIGDGGSQLISTEYPGPMDRDGSGNQIQLSPTGDFSVESGEFGPRVASGRCLTAPAMTTSSVPVEPGFRSVLELW